MGFVKIYLCVVEQFRFYSLFMHGSAIELSVLSQSCLPKAGVPCCMGLRAAGC